MSGSAPIECRGLTRWYGERCGIDDLTLVVSAGTITGFLGPNGAGKTTLIRILVGLLRPDAGEASLFGVPVARPEARRRVGYMPADPAFYPELSGAQNLDLLADLGGWDSVDRDWALSLLDLDADQLDRPVGGYSSGMVQKLGLVQAVQHRPDLVILDEPANRLDPLAHRRFEELVKSVARAGRTVFLSSHTLSEVEDVCDQVAMVRAGRLLLTSAVGELTAAAGRDVTIRYRDAPASAPPELKDVHIEGRTVVGRLDAKRLDVLRALLADPQVEDLLVEPASLEDAFMHLYERGGQ